MKQQEFIGSISFTVEAMLNPWDGGFGDCLIEVEGEIRVSLDDDSDAEAGKMSLTIIKLEEALRAGVSAYEVFDYSTALATAYTDLFDHRGQFRRRHKFDRTFDDLLYIDTIKLNRGFRKQMLLAQAVETSIAVLGSKSLVFAYDGDLNQHGLNWQHHGFKSAGRTGVIIRDNRDVDPEDLATWMPPEDGEGLEGILPLRSNPK